MASTTTTSTAKQKAAKKKNESRFKDDIRTSNQQRENVTIHNYASSNRNQSKPILVIKNEQQQTSYVMATKEQPSSSTTGNAASATTLQRKQKSSSYQERCRQASEELRNIINNPNNHNNNNIISAATRSGRKVIIAKESEKYPFHSAQNKHEMKTKTERLQSSVNVEDMSLEQRQGQVKQSFKTTAANVTEVGGRNNCPQNNDAHLLKTPPAANMNLSCNSKKKKNMCVGKDNVNNDNDNDQQQCQLLNEMLSDSVVKTRNQGSELQRIFYSCGGGNKHDHSSSSSSKQKMNMERHPVFDLANEQGRGEGEDNNIVFHSLSYGHDDHDDEDKENHNYDNNGSILVAVSKVTLPVGLQYIQNTFHLPPLDDITSSWEFDENVKHLWERVDKGIPCKPSQRNNQQNSQQQHRQHLLFQNMGPPSRSAALSSSVGNPHRIQCILLCTPTKAEGTILEKQITQQPLKQLKGWHVFHDSIFLLNFQIVREKTVASWLQKLAQSQHQCTRLAIWKVSSRLHKTKLRNLLFPKSSSLLMNMDDDDDDDDKTEVRTYDNSKRTIQTDQTEEGYSNNRVIIDRSEQLLGQSVSPSAVGQPLPQQQQQQQQQQQYLQTIIKTNNCGNHMLSGMDNTRINLHQSQRPWFTEGHYAKDSNNSASQLSTILNYNPGIVSVSGNGRHSNSNIENIHTSRYQCPPQQYYQQCREQSPGFTSFSAPPDCAADYANQQQHRMLFNENVQLIKNFIADGDSEQGPPQTVEQVGEWVFTNRLNPGVCSVWPVIQDSVRMMMEMNQEQRTRMGGQIQQKKASFFVCCRSCGSTDCSDGNCRGGKPNDINLITSNLPPQNEKEEEEEKGCRQIKHAVAQLIDGGSNGDKTHCDGQLNQINSLKRKQSTLHQLLPQQCRHTHNSQDDSQDQEDNLSSGLKKKKKKKKKKLSNNLGKEIAVQQNHLQQY